MSKPKMSQSLGGRDFVLGPRIVLNFDSSSLSISLRVVNLQERQHDSTVENELIVTYGMISRKGILFNRYRGNTFTAITELIYSVGCRVHEFEWKVLTRLTHAQSATNSSKKNHGMP